MELQQAIEQLQRFESLRSRANKLHLFVPIFSPGAIGGTPRVKVQAMQAGIDWDAGAVLLSTEKPLTTLSPEDVAAIRESVKKGHSWHAQKELDAMSKRIQELETALAEANTSIEAGWGNFNALQHINNWLIERGLLHCEEDGDEMAAARNVTRSIARLHKESQTDAAIEAYWGPLADRNVLSKEQIAEAEEAYTTQWISVKDGLPENQDEVRVQVLRNNGERAIKETRLTPALTHFIVEYSADGSHPLETVTHWSRKRD